ncbi:hypothetical protein C3Y87_11310 [Carbonactinospora thermoautotrophica]|uniref:Uncharacterized protein n=1 Tax=Carbonactinospora thermoautotrophica TaxID=1469144 RepID=A0A132MJ24_9ACTN|nr:hypothetical protein [Carbonactinospora thermoautotrophica]KWW97870.1 hypothetical protein TH66_20890 [Carbonactinospora thermoautotrophica]KWX07599.1 hypothetical protein TR74_18310 [Carbonactinospora thermoautotrophica]MCX9191992.1 hypothetical protein [Carbonactinospora thermoautotrophica]
MLIKALRDLGVSSDLSYMAAMGSILLAVISWAASKRAQDRATAERWGIFMGLWAPTFMGIGNALKIEEMSREK